MDQQYHSQFNRVGYWLETLRKGSPPTASEVFPSETHTGLCVRLPDLQIPKQLCQPLRCLITPSMKSDRCDTACKDRKIRWMTQQPGTAINIFLLVDGNVIKLLLFRHRPKCQKSTAFWPGIEFSYLEWSTRKINFLYIAWKGMN